jgi:hypothetical protein
MAQAATESDLQFEDALHALTDDERKEECNEDFIDFEPIPPELAIRFRVRRVLKCYNAINLARWIMTGLYPRNGAKRVRDFEPVEPTTKIAFTPPQLERLYTFVRNILESQRDRLDSDDRTLLNQINRELADDWTEQAIDEDRYVHSAFPRIARNVRQNIIQSLKNDCGLDEDAATLDEILRDGWLLSYYWNRKYTIVVRQEISRLQDIIKHERWEEVRNKMAPMFELAMRAARNFDLSSPYQQVRGENEPRQALQFVDWWNLCCFLSYMETLRNVSETFEFPEIRLEMYCGFERTQFMNWVYVQSRFFQTVEEKNEDHKMVLWRNRVRETCPAGVFYENRIVKPFHLNERRLDVYAPPDAAFKTYREPQPAGAEDMDVDR